MILKSLVVVHYNLKEGSGIVHPISLLVTTLRIGALCNSLGAGLHTGRREKEREKLPLTLLTHFIGIVL
jgi:hypothetical protein